MPQHTNQPPRRHAWRAALWGLMVVALTLLPQTSHASAANALLNGSFEGGFVNQPHCRWRTELYDANVGAGWTCFTNFGAAHYGFYADAWSPVVADGQYSQLIEINTWGLEHGDNDRYAGIYQTVPVQAGVAYQFSLRGLIRTTNLDGDEWRYRVQVGYLDGQEAGTDWRKVQNWTDVGWDTYYPRTEPGALSDYQTLLVPKSDQLTLFVRVWKKWGLTNEELDVNLDTIRLLKVGTPQP